MGRTVKPKDEVDLDVFFAGVREVRSYLERHNQDPTHRRQRLGALVTELIKAREPRELASWLLRELAGAVGASGAALYVCNMPVPGWKVWQHTGNLDAASFLPTIGDLAPRGEDIVEVTGGLVVPCLGVERLVAAIVLLLTTPLDAAAQNLLQALAATAGVALEQSLTLEALAS